MFITIHNKIDKLTGPFFLGFKGPIIIGRKTVKYADIHFKTILLNKGKALIFDSIKIVKKELIGETVEKLSEEISKDIAKEKSKIQIIEFSFTIQTNFIKEISENEI